MIKFISANKDIPSLPTKEISFANENIPSLLADGNSKWLGRGPIPPQFYRSNYSAVPP